MFILSKPQGTDTIPPGMFAYVGQKLKNDFYHFVLTAFNESQISQADLAKKIGIDKGQLNRLLSGPGNWTMDTVAKILFAINGHIIVPSGIAVDGRPPSNMTKPTWLVDHQKLEQLEARTNVPKQDNIRPTTSAPKTDVKIISKIMADTDA